MPIETIGQLLCELASERGEFETSDLEQMRKIVESEGTVTAKVLQAMFTENTGRHVLDSGGAYGRNWERNQKKEWEKLELQYFDGNIYRHAYVYLNENFEYDFEADLKFHTFAQSEEQKNKSWYANMREYCECVINTYNGECNLSQTLQYGIGSDENGQFILLQVHGGCDVRGGYTTPHVFRSYDDAYIESADWWISCECEFAAASDDAYSAYPDNAPIMEGYRIKALRHIREEQDLVIDYEGKWGGNLVCPCCGKLIDIQGNDLEEEFTFEIAFDHIKEYWVKSIEEFGFETVNEKAKEVLKDHPQFKNRLYKRFKTLRPEPIKKVYTLWRLLFSSPLF